MTLTLAGNPALTQAQFLSIATATEVNEGHYYDPRGDAEAILAPVTHATTTDGDWVVLDGGARMQLAECTVGECATLDIDASMVASAVQLQITLPKTAEEPLYGTGDAPLHANVSGTVREMQLRVDTTSASSLNETHEPIPLVLWPRRGAGVFMADDRAAAIDLGAADPEKVTLTVTLPVRGTVRFYLYTAEQPLDLVREYVALTALPAVPPRWAFAPMQWRNEWQNTAELLADANTMRSLKIPGSTIWIDNPWETAYNNFIVDETRFNGFDAAIQTLEDQGYHVIFWSTPYVDKGGLTDADHVEGAANHYFLTDESDHAFDWPWANGPGALIDFTHDGATQWWQDRINRVVSRGAAGFKLDYGEEFVTDIGGSIVQFKSAAGDNSDHANRYAAGYHKAYLDTLPPGDGFLITRHGAWGEQATNTAIWPGDLDPDFREFGSTNPDGKRAVGGLPSAISRGLSLSVSGYPFYGSDIGGFRGFPTSESLVRWAEYAALGTIMQLGGGGDSHNAWDTTLFDVGTGDIYKKYASLHMQLDPLLWTLAQRAGVDGTPVTRPARFVYDCECDDAMFLLGDDILVAPVVTAGATTRSVTLPPGLWFDANTGASLAGGSTTTVAAPLDTLPMFYRAGSLVPMYAQLADTLLPTTVAGVTSYTDPAFSQELRLVYTPGPEHAQLLLHDQSHAMGDGATISVAGGSEYQVFTVDVDGRGQTGVFATPTGVTVSGAELVLAASAAALQTCASPGCWYVDAATKHLQARVFAATGQIRSLTIH
jgi:alpha-D-xyloside xylohydrolase